MRTLAISLVALSLSVAGCCGNESTIEKATSACNGSVKSVDEVNQTFECQEPGNY